LNILKSFFALSKFVVSISVTITAVTGYILASGKFDYKLILTAAGVYLLASGASALNQVQEYRTDAMMERTRIRPIPQGKISRNSAIIISVLLIMAGSAILIGFTPLICFLLGLFNVLWYNLLYTSLKFRSAFAIIPGALSGVIPVFIGWAATEAPLFDPQVVILGFFLYIWQIPHFWLLIVKYGKQYESAGLSSLTALFSEDKIKNLIFIWLISSVVVALFLPFFNIIGHPVLVVIFSLMNIWLMIYFSFSILIRKIPFSFRPAFIQINIFQVLVMLLLITDKFIR
jgi:protoheme IX farnesyltransferase